MASGFTVVELKNSLRQQHFSHTVCVSLDVRPPTSPKCCCVGHHRLQGDTPPPPKPSSPTEPGIPFLSAHPTCPPQSQKPQEHLCLQPSPALLPLCRVCWTDTCRSPSVSHRRGCFLGVRHVIANTYLQHCSSGVFSPLSLFGGVNGTPFLMPNMMPTLFHKAGVTQQRPHCPPCSFSYIAAPWKANGLR